ncbi:hypothetical protein EHQ12_14220 [Leptospira gomenensis]|uniref:Uncharacterized protein n=1 Tax=Leptospira gomenensis TaxID=2484974 RepID=A0A5F1YRY1_9LEPT|nr:hypothetical protein [Leptospira gomenensis]TGK27900.1 hypothetical protein EHQ17_19340 [Leptospira gomenensis]TGK36341.1 hypothetical protein EHQ12_14220 [Leptospira gomenensis]TGK42822.1 hypothetical protein EHQ07_13750 [Leptospira gomenensis]TGK60803.1 hypothetical protein EHQ13_10705 [Leptospira gomenensis]
MNETEIKGGQSTKTDSFRKQKKQTLSGERKNKDSKKKNRQKSPFPKGQGTSHETSRINSVTDQYTKTNQPSQPQKPALQNQIVNEQNDEQSKPTSGMDEIKNPSSNR